MASSSSIKDLLSELMGYFRSLLGLSLGLGHFSKFYDTDEINKAMLNAITKTLSEFEPSISKTISPEKIPEVLQEFQSEVMKWNKESLSRNEANRTESERFMEQLINNECFLYETSIEARLSQTHDGTGIDLEAVKTAAISKLKMSWKPGNAKFQEEQLLKFEGKLDEINSKYQSQGITETPAEKVPSGQDNGNSIHEDAPGLLPQPISSAQLEGMPILSPAPGCSHSPNDPQDEILRSQNNSQMIMLPCSPPSQSEPRPGPSKPMELEVYPSDNILYYFEDSDPLNDDDSGAYPGPSSLQSQSQSIAGLWDIMPREEEIEERDIVPLFKKRRKRQKLPAEKDIPAHIRTIGQGATVKYQCQFHPKRSFKGKNRIKYHLNCIKKEQDYPFVCEPCNARFKNSQHFDLHYKKFHGNI